MPPLPDDVRPTYDDLALQVEALTAATEADALTDPAALPASGSASYEGVIGFGANGGVNAAPEDFAGEMRLGVDFATGHVDGVIDNFAQPQNGPLDGSFTLSNGELDRGSDPDFAPTYTFDVDGTLVAGNQEWIADATGGGAFLDGTDSTFGFVDGTLTAAPGNGSPGVGSLSGAYVLD